jgi:L-2-hydroxyglutarate oxidase LhgO
LIFVGILSPWIATFVAASGTDGTVVTSATPRNESAWHGKVFINCAGLYSDHVAKLAGFNPSVKIIPFRGEYYTLRETSRYLVKGLIYPVADPRFPFLGVHLTKMIDGGVECGPNAVLALGRESYEKSQVNWKELWEILTYPGFQALALAHWQTGAKELLRSYSKNLYARSLRELVPVISPYDLEPRVAGIRAQAVAPDGSLVDDFLIEKQSPSVIHVLNTPSPAATACLTIGEHIASMV